MTLEATVAKLMWILGNKDRLEGTIEELFYKSINYDLIFGLDKRHITH